MEPKLLQNACWPTGTDEEQPSGADEHLLAPNLPKSNRKFGQLNNGTTESSVDYHDSYVRHPKSPTPILANTENSIFAKLWSKKPKDSLANPPTINVSHVDDG